MSPVPPPPHPTPTYPIPQQVAPWSPRPPPGDRSQPLSPSPALRPAARSLRTPTRFPSLPARFGALHGLGEELVQGQGCLEPLESGRASLLGGFRQAAGSPLCPRAGDRLLLAEPEGTPVPLGPLPSRVGVCGQPLPVPLPASAPVRGLTSSSSPSSSSCRVGAAAASPPSPGPAAAALLPAGEGDHARSFPLALLAPRPPSISLSPQ